VGDAPLIGSGTIADDRSCAVSCTGWGEIFIRHNVAHEISARMRLARQSAAEAIRTLLAGPLAAPKGTGGIITVDYQGHIVLDYNSRGMYRAWMREQGPAHTAIDQTIVEHD
jgi:beta-aspartyl-peptidase (threonine type)